MKKMIPKFRINKNQYFSKSKYSTRSKTFYDHNYLNPIGNYKQSLNNTSDFTQTNKT